MNDKRIFELTGIKVIKEIEYESKLLIINNITNLLTQKIKTINYRQIKEKLLDTPIYLAEVPEQYYGVVYLHDNSTIYIPKEVYADSEFKRKVDYFKKRIDEKNPLT